MRRALSDSAGTRRHHAGRAGGAAADATSARGTRSRRKAGASLGPRRHGRLDDERAFEKRLKAARSPG